MDDILRIARQLGVDEKETHRLAKLNKFLSNRIVATTLPFLVGLIAGAFFPKVTTITKTYYTYPYFSGGFTSSIGFTRAHKKSLMILTIILGILGFVLGFTISSQLIFARTYIEYEYPPIEYGVFVRKTL